MKAKALADRIQCACTIGKNTFSNFKYSISVDNDFLAKI